MQAENQGVELYAAGEWAGDFHVYPSDQFHRYRNEGAGRLRFIRNVVH